MHMRAGVITLVLLPCAAQDPSQTAERGVLTAARSAKAPRGDRRLYGSYGYSGTTFYGYSGTAFFGNSYSMPNNFFGNANSFFGNSYSMPGDPHKDCHFCGDSSGCLQGCKSGDDPCTDFDICNTHMSQADCDMSPLDTWCPAPAAAAGGGDDEPKEECPQACVDAFNDWERIRLNYFTAESICTGTIMQEYHQITPMDLCKDCPPCQICAQKPGEQPCYNYMRTNNMADWTCFNSACGYDWVDQMVDYSSMIDAAFKDPGTNRVDEITLKYAIFTGEREVCPAAAQIGLCEWLQQEKDCNEQQACMWDWDANGGKGGCEASGDTMMAMMGPLATFLSSDLKDTHYNITDVTMDNMFGTRRVVNFLENDYYCKSAIEKWECDSYTDSNGFPCDWVDLTEVNGYCTVSAASILKIWKDEVVPMAMDMTMREKYMDMLTEELAPAYRATIECLASSDMSLKFPTSEGIMIGCPASRGCALVHSTQTKWCPDGPNAWDIDERPNSHDGMMLNLGRSCYPSSTCYPTVDHLRRLNLSVSESLHDLARAEVACGSQPGDETCASKSLDDGKTYECGLKARSGECEPTVSALHAVCSLEPPAISFELQGSGDSFLIPPEYDHDVTEVVGSLSSSYGPVCAKNFDAQAAKLTCRGAGFKSGKSMNSGQPNLMRKRRLAHPAPEPAKPKSRRSTGKSWPSESRKLTGTGVYRYRDGQECVDTDNDGRGTSDYANCDQIHYYYAMFNMMSPFCNGNSFDTMDWSAADMCCSCGGGAAGCSTSDSDALTADCACGSSLCAQGNYCWTDGTCNSGPHPEAVGNSNNFFGDDQWFFGDNHNDLAMPTAPFDPAPGLVLQCKGTEASLGECAYTFGMCSDQARVQCSQELSCPAPVVPGDFDAHRRRRRADLQRLPSQASCDVKPHLCNQCAVNECSSICEGEAAKMMVEHRPQMAGIVQEHCSRCSSCSTYNDTCASFAHCQPCEDKFHASETLAKLDMESFASYVNMLTANQMGLTPTGDLEALAGLQSMLSLGCPAMVSMLQQNLSIGCFDDASGVLPGVKTVSEFCCKTCGGSGDNSCETSKNSKCDVPSGECAPGTDMDDCRVCANSLYNDCEWLGCRWVEASSTCSGDAPSPKAPEPGPTFTPVPGTLDQNGQVITATGCVGVVECYNKQRYCKGKVDCEDQKVREDCPRTCGTCGQKDDDGAGHHDDPYFGEPYFSGYSNIFYQGNTANTFYAGNTANTNYNGYSNTHYNGYSNTHYNGYSMPFFRL